MKSLSSVLCAIAAAGLFVAGNAAAEDIKDFEAAKKLMTDKGLTCLACHQLDTKAMGPSFNAVGLFYYKKDAQAALEKKVVEGTKGTWGASSMMPANPTAKEVAGDLVKWILSLNPEGPAKEAADLEIKAMPKK